MDNLRNVWVHDGNGNVINSLNGALNVHDADSHIELVNRHFLDFDTATENPTGAISPGDTLVTVADTTGFAVGNPIVIRDAAGDIRESRFVITDLVVNTSITVDRPIDIAYTTSALLELVIDNMNVVGTLAAPLIYTVTPPSDEVWHIARVLISITDNAAFDDTRFGSIAGGIANGLTIRENKTALNTLTNWKTNQGMVEDMYDVEYSESAPAGSDGLRGRFTLKKAGVIVRLDGSVGDSLEVLIQDDLSALDLIRMKAQGHKEG